MKNDSLKNIDAQVVGKKINDIIFGINEEIDTVTKENEKQSQQFLLRLAYEGGSIVSSAACSNEEILAASVDNRFLVINTFGFVLRRNAK